MYEKSFLITRFACVIMFATAFCVLFLISLVNYFDIFSNTTVQTSGNLLFYCKSLTYKYIGIQILRSASEQVYNQHSSLTNMPKYRLSETDNYQATVDSYNNQT